MDVDANFATENLMIMRTLGHALCLVLCSSLHSEEAMIKCLGETSPFGLFLRHYTSLSLRSVVGCWESFFVDLVHMLLKTSEGTLPHARFSVRLAEYKLF